MSILDYPKKHPWATGVIVLIGGIIFIMIVRGSSGGGTSNTSAPVGPSGPSDTQISVAGALEAQKVQAASQSESDNLAAQIASKQIDSGLTLNLYSIGAQERVATNEIDSGENVALSQIQSQETVSLTQLNNEREVYAKAFEAKQNTLQALLASLPSLKKKNRDDVLQAFITDQPYYPAYHPGAVASTIGAIGNAASGIAQVLPFI